MSGGPDPVEHGSGELIRRHARMSRGDDLQQAFLAGFGQRLGVVVQQRLERLLGPPLWMLRCHRLDLIDGEGELKIERLFAPQRAIIVESCDPLGRWHELLAVLGRHACDEVDDGLLGGAIGPGRQRVALSQHRTAGHEIQGKEEQRLERARRPPADLCWRHALVIRRQHGRPRIWSADRDDGPGKGPTFART